ncbi:MAG: translocation/assembly module TamB [Muribaculum sp.]|nr:translocation/assembly module TamB [Muribaculum sp.]
MGHLIKNTIIRRILKTLLWVIIALLLLPVVLYVPFVQDFVKDVALKEVAKSTGMDIRVDRLRLQWPLRLTLDGVMVVPTPGDTMVMARHAAIQVEPLPLLALDVRIQGQFDNVRYRMGTPDSIMYLNADVNSFVINPSNYNLRKQRINISTAILDGADVELMMNGTDTTTNEKTDTASMALFINAHELVLRNIRYRMSMLPTIDSLGVDIPKARLSNGTVDMSKSRIHASLLQIDSIAATYLTPDAEYLASHPVDSIPTEKETPTSDSTMWTITGDALRLTAKNALYGVRGAMPLPGLDMNYLQVSDVAIEVDSFYNRGTDITVPLKRLHANERCGIKLDASGTFAMDSSGMTARNFDIATIFSSIKFDAFMGMGDMTADTSLPVAFNGDGKIGLPDVEMIMPSMKPMLATVPRYNDLRLNAKVGGTIGNIAIDRVDLSLPNYITLAMNGNIANVMKPEHLGGHLALNGNLKDVNFIKPTLLEARMAKQVKIPPTVVTGNMDMIDGAYDGTLKVVTGTGQMALDGKWNGRMESYNADLNIARFPVMSFMPELGVGDITAHVVVDGHGYNPFSPKTKIKADVDIVSAEYMKVQYTDLKLWANLDTNYVDAGIISMNPTADLDISVEGRLDQTETYDLTFEGDVRTLDLHALNLSDSVMNGSFTMDGRAKVAPSKSLYDVDMTIASFDWNMPGAELSTPSIDLRLNADDSTVTASLKNETLTADLTALCPLDTFTSRLSGAMTLLDKQLAQKRIAVDTLQHALPPLALTIKSGRQSLVSDYLSASKTSINDFTLNVINDSLISLQADAHGIVSNTTKIDTITFSALQHGKYLIYKGAMNNNPGSFDQFAHVRLSGFIADENLAAFINQSNIDNQTGFKIGFNVTAGDSVLTLRLTPLNPIIGYKEWTLNSDNFISYNMPKKHFDGNLQLTNGESHLKIYTEHSNESDSIADSSEDVVVSASGIELADWLSLSPFAPPIKGTAGADMHINWDPATESLSGNGNMNLDNLYYGGQRVGSFLFDLGLNTNSKGVVNASASLMVDSLKVITAVGSLNDSTSGKPFNLDFSMIHFPLKIVNPFLPPNMATLHGMLNGKMDITGTLISPIFNGYLDFDSTNVMIDMIGSGLKFSEEQIPVDSNIVKFNNYTISGTNENPLYINGTVDINELTSPKIDLALNAKNMQLMNSSRGKGAEVYGRAFMDVNATVKGNMQFMRVNAYLNLLEGSNVTYVMSTMGSGMESMSASDEDMVRFVQFNDSTSVMESDTISNSGLAMMLDAQVVVSQGTTINVDITPNGHDKAQIQGSGDLTFAMSPFSDMRLTGRYTIDKGFVRYTPPVLSQKLFNFESGSYIAFNGDMLNPILSIKATDDVKANVTEEGQNSRIVNFLVSLSVTNSLQDMDVAFDLSTNDDITVQNELQAMSPNQRANQAMNLLLYNVYTGPGTKGTNLSGNPLYSFLASQLNTWAANTIKGVDISFGIDQYDRTYEGATSTTTSYSYQVSKSLFNDRVKIVVGGNYTTDADTDENFSQNLINDISFEYMLNRSGSMYLRLFRHVGYESILEGEVIQTGVGFVYKRKIRRISELFKFLPRRREENDIKVPSPTEKQNDETSEK